MKEIKKPHKKDAIATCVHTRIDKNGNLVATLKPIKGKKRLYKQAIKFLIENYMDIELVEK